MLGTRPGRALRRRRSNADPLAHGYRHRARRTRTCGAPAPSSPRSFSRPTRLPSAPPDQISSLYYRTVGWRHPSPHCQHGIKSRILHVAHYANYHRVVEFASFFPNEKTKSAVAPRPPRPAAGAHTRRGPAHRPARRAGGPRHTPTRSHRPRAARGAGCGGAGAGPRASCGSRASGTWKHLPIFSRGTPVWRGHEHR